MSRMALIAVMFLSAGVWAAPEPPVDLHAMTVSSSRVDLHWSGSASSSPPPAYAVFRDGRKIAVTSARSYVDQGLFANTRFVYTVAAVDREGNTSKPSQAVAARTAAFEVSDVPVGDPQVSYANIEFSADGRYAVWFEQSTDGSGEGTAWHCAMDPDTGEFIPPDCKGFRAFETTSWGRPNPGMAAFGPYYVGMDRDGRLIAVLPTGPYSGKRIVLPTPADPLRRAIYPTDTPEAREGYVFWIENEKVPGGGMDPRNDWFELRYLALSQPELEHVIERQDRPQSGSAPMDAGFVRWFRGRASLTYGFRPGLYVQMQEFDPTQPDPAPVQVTFDPVSKIDPFTFVFDGDEIMLAGAGGAATTNVYRRAQGTTYFSLAETISPPDSLLQNPVLAQSNEAIIFEGQSYTAYQVNEAGDGFFDTAFGQTGEIWLSTVGQSSQMQWRLSEDSDRAKAEPEPYVGNTKVWVFYSSLPKGADPLRDRWALRRTETPLGQR